MSIDDNPSSTDPTTTATTTTQRQRRRGTPRRGPPSSLKSSLSRQRRQTITTTTQKNEPFNASSLTRRQNPNTHAPPLPLPPSFSSSPHSQSINHAHFRTYSLDELFGSHLNMSSLFAHSRSFRDDIRRAMREDILRTTPSYATLSPAAVDLLKHPSSSLQGSWARPPTTSTTTPRMTALSQTLSHHLGNYAPTGDVLLNTIGSLCGDAPTTHWIDIVGIRDRMVSHSWHMDTGRLSAPNAHTVMWGFPPEDGYDGTGVFSHIVKLERECWAAEGHPEGNPVVMRETVVGEEFVVRPVWREGGEILVYRDVDVWHSAPDVAYRESVMRFM